jgi:hypothetical protein
VLGVEIEKSGGEVQVRVWSVLRLERLWRSSQACGEVCFHHSANPFAVNMDFVVEVMVVERTCGLT